MNIRNITQYYLLDKIVLYVCMLLASVYPLYAQNGQNETAQDAVQDSDDTGTSGKEKYIITAEDFMDTVAARYGLMDDFQALLIITREGNSEYSEIYIKPPTKLRIVYRKPEGQVINSDGEDFYIYLPTDNVVLHQKRGTTQSSAGTFVTRSGLDILLKNYSISYFDRPDYVPLENDKEIISRVNSLFGRRTSLEKRKIVKIRLRRKSPTQSFREIILSVGRDNLIYRVEATTFNNENIQFDFINIFINEGIPDTLFDFEVPATAPVIDNLFYKETKKIEEETSNE